MTAVVDDGRSVVDDGRSVMDDDRSVVNDDCSVMDDDRSVVNDDCSVMDDDRSVVVDDDSVMDDDRSVVYDDRSVVDSTSDDCQQNTNHSMAITLSSQMSISLNDSQFSMNSVSSHDSQFAVPSSQRSEVISVDSSQSSTSSFVTFKYIQGTTCTQNKCFICNSTSERKCIPWTAVAQVWFRLSYYVPKTNRVCPHHLDLQKKLFTSEALQQIEATKQGIHVKS